MTEPTRLVIEIDLLLHPPTHSTLVPMPEMETHPVTTSAQMETRFNHRPAQAASEMATTKGLLPRVLPAASANPSSRHQPGLHRPCPCPPTIVAEAPLRSVLPRGLGVLPAGLMPQPETSPVHPCAAEATSRTEPRAPTAQEAEVAAEVTGAATLARAEETLADLEATTEGVTATAADSDGESRPCPSAATTAPAPRTLARNASTRSNSTSPRTRRSSRGANFSRRVCRRTRRSESSCSRPRPRGCGRRSRRSKRPSARS